MPTLIAIALVAAYGVGVFKFWKGFHRTNFSNGKVTLALLWPVLVLSNKSYRENFNRALKG
jgi:hypothetical protein